jgi:hypothetical protein
MAGIPLDAGILPSLVAATFSEVQFARIINNKRNRLVILRSGAQRRVSKDGQRAYAAPLAFLADGSRRAAASAAALLTMTSRVWLIS